MAFQLRSHPLNCNPFSTPTIHLPPWAKMEDAEDMILWYLKDRNFSVKDSVSNLTKAIVTLVSEMALREFGASELSEQSIKSVTETGKSYVHDSLDVHGRPVLITKISKHLPGFDVLYNHSPKRLGEVLVADAYLFGIFILSNPF